jgi:hypothetical protein
MRWAPLQPAALGRWWCTPDLLQPWTASAVQALPCQPVEAHTIHAGSNHLQLAYLVSSDSIGLGELVVAPCTIDMVTPLVLQVARRSLSVVCED